MIYEIFLQHQSDKLFKATAVRFPSVQIEGISRQETIAKMREALRDYLTSGELVTIDLSPLPPNG